MKRRDFLTTGTAVGAAVVCGTQQTSAQVPAGSGEIKMPHLPPPATPAELNLCLQWGAIPGDEINQKLDFLEAAQYRDELFKLEALLKGK